MVPELSRSLGIVIAMYYRDHHPVHFHANYGGYEVTVTIEDGVVEGQGKVECQVRDVSGYLGLVEHNFGSLGELQA